MLKIIIATLVLLIGASAVSAEEDSQGNYSEPITLSCTIINQQPKDSDPDPTKTISVVLDTNLADKIVGITVWHTTILHKTYTRTDQYTIEPLIEMPGKAEIFWHGILKKSKNVEMIGRVWKADSDRHWYYSETRFEKGVVVSKVTAACKVNSPG